MTVAATYGRPKGTIDDPGGMGGAQKARDEWWAGQGQNDIQQERVTSGGAVAGQMSADAQTAGPAVNENRLYAEREASGAGGHQAGAINLASRLAAGNTPSAAAMQLQRGLNTATAQQTAMGRSARGGAAIASAGSNAAANTANLQQNAFTQGGLLRARDMSQGRGLLGSALGQAQSQDEARMGEANRVGQFNSQFRDQSALNWGNAALGLGEVENAQQSQDLDWYRGGMAPVEAQSEADQQAQRWEYDRRKAARAAFEEDK